MARRFVVLDRDGTMIEERHYLSNPSQVVLIPGVTAGLRRLREIGLGLVMITNQSGVERGFFSEECLQTIHHRLCTLLEAEGVFLDGIYYCPHTPARQCRCRKPEPGLLELAAEKLGFDLETSFVIGDKECDIALGQHVGATTFLVRTGYGFQVESAGTVVPDHVVDSVKEAVPIIEGAVAHFTHTRFQV
jgi:histidinol-phosphate phosphatase family protein